MEIVLLGVMTVAALYAYKSYQARQVVRRHSYTLAKMTGSQPERVYREMVTRKLTPGEWAVANGLDPLTFEPVQPGDEWQPNQRRRSEHLPRSDGREYAAQEVWERIRLDENAPLPSLVKLQFIAELHREFIYLRTVNPPLLAEATRQAEVLVELHDAGARVDGEEVNRALKHHGAEATEFSGPRSQETYDGWQRAQVQRRDEDGVA